MEQAAGAHHVAKARHHSEEAADVAALADLQGRRTGAALSTAQDSCDAMHACMPRHTGDCERRRHCNAQGRVTLRPSLC